MRSLRLADFAQRASWDSSNVEERGTSQFVRIHPFADETELLERTGGSPEQCSEVDAYWLVNGDVYFLQVIASTTRVGLSARLYHQETARLNLVAELDTPVILEHDFYAAMDAFTKVGVLDRPSAEFTDKLQLVCPRAPSAKQLEE